VGRGVRRRRARAPLRHAALRRLRGSAAPQRPPHRRGVRGRVARRAGVAAPVAQGQPVAGAAGRPQLRGPGRGHVRARRAARRPDGRDDAGAHLRQRLGEGCRARPARCRRRRAGDARRPARARPRRGGGARDGPHGPCAAAAAAGLRRPRPAVPARSRPVGARLGPALQARHPARGRGSRRPPRARGRRGGARRRDGPPGPPQHRPGGVGGDGRELRRRDRRPVPRARRLAAGADRPSPRPSPAPSARASRRRASTRAASGSRPSPGGRSTPTPAST
jgi:hypothetical protein